MVRTRGSTSGEKNDFHIKNFPYDKCFIMHNAENVTHNYLNVNTVKKHRQNQTNLEIVLFSVHSTVVFERKEKRVHQFGRISLGRKIKHILPYDS